MLSTEQARSARRRLMALVDSLGHGRSEGFDGRLVGVQLAEEQPESVWEAVTVEGDEQHRFRCAFHLALSSGEPSGWWAVARLTDSTYEMGMIDGPQQRTHYEAELIDLVARPTVPLIGTVVDLSTPWVTRRVPWRADAADLDPAMQATRAGRVAWAVATAAPDSADQVRALWAEAPDDLPLVLRALMTTPLEICALADLAVDHVAERDLPSLGDAFAVAAGDLAPTSRSVAAGVARILALQAPETLRPHAEAARRVRVEELTGIDLDADIDEDEPVFHVEFPAGYLAHDETPDRLGLPPSPTWHLDTPIAGSGRFGGTVAGPCGLCGQPLHLLIGWDVMPPDLRSPAEVVTCLSCVGWSAPVLYFAHDDAGATFLGPAIEPRTPEFPAEPLPATTVTARITPRRWRRQGWDRPQNLHRFGGSPTWVQAPEVPDCPRCDLPMDFLLQLDSLDIAGGPWWLWGSGGLLYVFSCSGCDTSATFWQCS